MKMLKDEKNRIGPEEIDKIRQEAASARAEGRSIFIFQMNDLHREGIFNNPKMARVEHDVMNMIEAVQIAGWSVVLPLSYTPSAGLMGGTGVGTVCHATFRPTIY